MAHLVDDGDTDPVQFFRVLGIGEHEGIDQTGTAAARIGIGAGEEGVGLRVLDAEEVQLGFIDLLGPGHDRVRIEGRIVRPVGPVGMVAGLIREMPHGAGHVIGGDQAACRSRRHDGSFAEAGGADRTLRHGGQIPVHIDHEGARRGGHDEEGIARAGDDLVIEAQIEGRAGAQLRDHQVDRGAIGHGHNPFQIALGLPVAPVEEIRRVGVLIGADQRHGSGIVLHGNVGNPVLAIGDRLDAGEDCGRGQEGRVRLDRQAGHFKCHIDIGGLVIAGGLDPARGQGDMQLRQGRRGGGRRGGGGVVCLFRRCAGGGQRQAGHKGGQAQPVMMSRLVGVRRHGHSPLTRSGG